MDRLEAVAHQLMIIVGIFMYIFGSIGNFLNIYVFAVWSHQRRSTNKHHYGARTSNSSLYLLISAIANFLLIIYPLCIRILVDGYQYPVTKPNSLILCKLRFYVLQTANLISLTCTCMATLDQYLVSSRQVRLRQLSPTRQRTIKIIAAIVCIIGLHSLPIALYYDVNETGHCVIFSPAYALYYTFVVIIFLYGIIPMLFLVIFGSLTFKQLQSLQHTTVTSRHLHTNVHVDKQLSRMLLLICIAIVASSIPYCIQNVYNFFFVDAISGPSSVVQLCYIISIILFYTNPVSSFYIFFISTPTFRIQMRKLIMHNAHNNRLFNSQVHTITTPHILP